MNLSRAIAGLLSSHSRRSSQWSSVRRFPFGALQLAALSANAAAPAKRTRTAKPGPEADSSGFSSPVARTPATGLEEEASSDRPCPSEIPFQPKVANQVHLIGSVGVGVQLQTLPNGSYAAVSVLAREKTNGFPQFWIPVIFQGDLAQIAAYHLKENDVIYVTGQLSGDAPPHTIEGARPNIQVLAHSLSFVQNGDLGKVDDNKIEQDEPTSGFSGNRKKMNKFVDKLWDDLVLNPQNWRDYRMDKRNGLMQPNFPDFKHKETDKALWLGSRPSWVSAKLDGLVFDASKITKKHDKSDSTVPTKQNNYGKYLGNSGTSKQEKYSAAVSSKNKENLWKNLVDNPDDWWDNRSDKLKPNHPDFRHKTTGEALWLSYMPQWVLEKLPPVGTQKKVSGKAFLSKATLLS